MMGCCGSEPYQVGETPAQRDIHVWCPTENTIVNHRTPFQPSPPNHHSPAAKNAKRAPFLRALILHASVTITITSFKERKVFLDFVRAKSGGICMPKLSGQP